MSSVEHIEKLKNEIASLEESKLQMKKAAEGRLEQLNALIEHFRKINETAPNALGQLSNVMALCVLDKSLGVMVVSPEGKVLLFNTAIQKLLGVEAGDCDLSNENSPDIYLEDKVSPCPYGILGLTKVGQDKCRKLFVRHGKVPQGMWINILSLPLQDESSEKAGALLVVSDITEQVNIEEEIQKVYRVLESQIKSIETVQSELNLLMTKLGKPDWERSLAMANETVTIDMEAAGEIIKRLLIVDDMPVNRKLLGIQLEKLGFEVDQVDDGRPAVEMIKKQKYGLVLMDLDMPEMDGIQATIAIREYDRETNQHTPIVAMTSYDREGDREKCLSYGMDDYLCKGVTKKRLQEVIERCIRRQIPPAQTPPCPLIDEDQDVSVDLKALQETYGFAETTQIINLFFATMRTLMSCLRLAMDERDAKSINHFAYSFKGPCSSLGLQSMAKLAGQITADSESANWERAEKGLHVLESQSRQVIKQLEQYSTLEDSHRLTFNAGGENYVRP